MNVVAAVRRMEKRGQSPAADSEAARRDLVARLVEALTEERLPQGFAERAVAAYGTLSEELRAADRASQRVERSQPWLVGQPNDTPSAAFVESRERFRAEQQRPWLRDGRDPFASFRFSVPPAELAASSGERSACPGCGKSSKLYCAQCCVPTDPRLEALVPVRLPVAVDVVHHRAERRSKSSALHARVLCPDKVRFLAFPAELPPRYDAADTVLLYPDETATYLEDMDLSTVRRCIVIEAKWQGSRSVARDPRFAHLRRVKIRSRQTTFWRHQELGNEYLATLEAIYWFCVEHYERGAGAKYDGSFDDLLLVFAAIHRRVRENETAPRYWEVVGGGSKPEGKEQEAQQQ